MSLDELHSATSAALADPKNGASSRADFLLVEYQMMRGLKDQSVSIGDKRVDLHLGLATAVAGGLVLLAQTRVSIQDLLVVILLGSVGLLLVGITTVRQVIDRDILTIDYIRAGNRIRSYFAERDELLKGYLLMPTKQTYPPYGWHSSSRALTLGLNSLSLGALVTVGLMLQQEQSKFDLNDLWIGTAAGVVLYLVQAGYAKVKFSFAARAARASGSVSLHRAAKAP